MNNVLKLLKPRVFVQAVKKTVMVLRQPSGMKKLSNHLRDFVSGRGTPRFITTPPINELTASLTKKFQAAVENSNAENRVTPETLNAFQRELVGDDNLRTDDERFMALVYGPNKHY